jgi:hypothetical protein
VSPQKTQGYQPQNPPNADGTPNTAQQPPSLLFHYEGENQSILESDITDHYIEDNTAIQDQIALRPEIVTVDGYIGELNNIPPPALAILQQIANKLTIVSAYTPVLSATAELAYAEALLAYQTAANAVNSATSAWSSLNGTGGENVIGTNGLGSSFNAATGKVSNSQNKQQVMYQQFYGYWRARQLFTVQTPWAVFQNMSILRLQATQEADTNVITGFKVTFKMMRFSNTATTAGLSPILQGRASQQGSSLVDIGTTTPPTASISLTQGISNLGVP